MAMAVRTGPRWLDKLPSKNEQQQSHRNQKQNKIIFFLFLHIYSLFSYRTRWIPTRNAKGRQIHECDTDNDRYRFYDTKYSEQFRTVASCLISYFSISHSFLFCFNASKFIGRPFYVRGKKIFVSICPLPARPGSPPRRVVFPFSIFGPISSHYSPACVSRSLCIVVYVLMALVILHCQLEWLLHNSSIHQVESMLGWYRTLHMLGRHRANLTKKDTEED